MILLVLSTCDTSFQPLAENDHIHFSMYGYLDASADTQWVRITPLRDQLDMPAEVPEMTVTLEELSSGNSVTMKDSLFQNNNGFNYLNFWTTMDIEPEQSYRLVAEGPDGASSSVTVTTPGDFPDPKLSIVALGPPIFTVYEVERLADIELVMHYRINDPGSSRELVYRLPFRDAGYGTSELYSVYLDTEGKISPSAIPDRAELTDKYVFVASAGPEWITGIDSLDDPSYTLPTALSNVDDGVGYVVGILSKTVPFPPDE